MKKISEKQKSCILDLISKIPPDDLVDIEELRRVKSFNELSVKDASVLIQKLLEYLKRGGVVNEKVRHY